MKTSTRSQHAVAVLFFVGLCHAGKVCPPKEDSVDTRCEKPCNSTEECKHGEFCCAQRCGHSCVAPITVCDDDMCSGIAGTICQMKQVMCFTTPCYPVATCVTPMQEELRVGRISSGRLLDGCPVPSAGIIGDCAEHCTGDRDCRKGEKCCSNGCGHTCTKVPLLELTAGQAGGPLMFVQLLVGCLFWQLLQQL